MVHQISALALPETLFARFSKCTYHTDNWEDLVNKLYGNPNGMGLSAVPYIHTLTEEERKRTKQQSLYCLRVQFRWPPNGKFADEGSEPKQSYDSYYKSNYVGVIRKFRNDTRLVILEPLRFIESVLDEVKGKLLLRQQLPPQPLEEVAEHQRRLDQLMESRIGKDYIDHARDYFCLSEISRRSRRSVVRVEKDLSKIIGRIQVHPASGCWKSTSKNDYKRTFWMALGGIQSHTLYFFPSETQDSMFIKDKNILHSLLCELTLGKNHGKCCRPSHLKIGTSAENAVHIKIRKKTEQLFDLPPAKLHEYAAHISGIANIMLYQQQVMTPDEEKVHRRREAKRITYWEDLASKEKGMYATGGATQVDSEDKLEMLADKYELSLE